MQATGVRARIVPSGEWVMAAVFLVATVGVSLLLLNALRSPAPNPAAAPAPAAASAVPAAVPTHAVSVPVLLLMDGTLLRVGDTERRVQSALPGAVVHGNAEDAGALGPRVTRAYEYRGTRFLLVLEPFERRGERRIAGIYLQ